MQGVLYALAAAALFGASTPLAKSLLGNGIDPWLLAGLLYCGSGFGLGIAYVLRSRKAEASLQRTDLPWLALVVLFGGVAGPVLLMFGLARTSAASASLLLNLEGLATMAIAWYVFREYVDRRLLLGAFAILLGTMALSYHGTTGFGIGTLAIIGACVAWGISETKITRALYKQSRMARVRMIRLNLELPSSGNREQTMSYALSASKPFGTLGSDIH